MWLRNKAVKTKDSVLHCGRPLKPLSDQGGRERALVMNEIEFHGSVSGQELEENLTQSTAVSYCLML